MEIESLRTEWRRLYRTTPPARLSRDILARGIAHKLQEAAYGGLRVSTQRKLAALADSFAAIDAQAKAPKLVMPKPGATLVRTWHGQTHTVHVLPDGYEHQGQRYRSLSHVAKAITGAHWSGPRFFGLTAPQAREVTDEAA